MKKYQVHISQKYLRSRAVNIIAVVAVMLGVAALIIVTSVMDGFAYDIQARIRGVMSHIVIEGEQLVGIGDYEELIARIERVPEVAAASPLVECPFVLLRSGDRTHSGLLRGIDFERERRTSDIEGFIQRVYDESAEPVTEKSSQYENFKKVMAGNLARNSYNFNYDDGEVPEHPGLFVGLPLAMSLRVTTGSKITITAPTTILTFQNSDFIVVGGFRSGHAEYDTNLVYTSLRSAQDLLGLPGRVTSISVRLHDIEKADEAKEAIIKSLRNETPILNSANPADMSRVETAGIEVSNVVDMQENWLRVDGEGAGGEIKIQGIDEILKRAESPSSIALITKPVSGMPWYRIAAVDKSGNRFYAGSDRRYARLEQISMELPNMTSEDGLDLLDPTDISSIVIEVHGGTVDFSNIRFEDNRRVSVSTWKNKQSQLLRAVEVERYIQVIIMTLMVIIAGFCIMAILWLMVKERTRDIGILLSLGATRVGIVKIFLMNGLMIGASGAFLGFTLGWGISARLNNIEDFFDRMFGWRVFPPDIYYLDKLPHLEDPVQFAIMAGVAILVALGASVWPAIKAAQLDPVEALRHE